MGAAYSGVKMKGTADLQSRQKGAILGMFIGDALAMPVHWYYDRQALYRDYGHVTDYQTPRNPHPDSILWRSVYNVTNRAADILHDQRRYWGQHGIHYHQFLKAGENTLNLKLCALLIDTIVENGAYDSDAFLERYIDFMTTPGRHQDTYVEEYHRHFFTNYANGKPPRSCGIVEKHISGIIGMIPLIVYYAEDQETARRLAFQHLRLTHLGDRMTSAGNMLLDILLPLLNGASLKDTLVDKIKRQDNPLVGFPFLRWLGDPDETVIGRLLSSACYVEDALPATLYLALKYHHDPARGLIANTNLGGDNAGRGAVLGALLGAANGYQSFPESWVDGLRHPPSNLDFFTQIGKE
jgi:ADP-ribosyl-[dinitrogen reductase] hydrolase